MSKEILKKTMDTGMYYLYNSTKHYKIIIFKLGGTIYFYTPDKNLLDRFDDKYKTFGIIGYIYLYYASDFYVKKMCEIDELPNEYKVFKVLNSIVLHCHDFKMQNASYQIKYSYKTEDTEHSSVINFIYRNNNILVYDSSDRNYLDYIVLRYVLEKDRSLRPQVNIITHLPDIASSGYHYIIRDHINNYKFKKLHQYLNDNSLNYIHILGKKLEDIIIDENLNKLIYR